MIFITLTGGKVYISLDLSVNYVRNDNGADCTAVYRLDLVKGFVKIGMLLVTASDGEHLSSLFGGLESLFCADVIFMSCTEHNKHALGSGDTLAHLSLKVEKTRSVDYIELTVFPFNRSNRRRNGYISPLLLGIKVESGCTLVNSAESVRQTCDIKHSLRKSSLAAACVTCNSNISDILSVIVLQKMTSLRHTLISAHLNNFERRIVICKNVIINVSTF